VTSSVDVIDVSFPQIDRYHEHQYGFQYTSSLCSWRMVIELWSWHRDFMRIRDDVAWRINDMLRTKDSQEADCHTTADYVANLWDNIGRVKESWEDRRKYMLATDWENRDYDQFSNIDDAMKAFKGFPFICRIMDQEGICHSLIVLWDLKDGTIMWFEHRGQWTDWWFCEVKKAIQARRWEELFCRKI